MNPAAANGRVEVEGEFYLRPSDLTNAADDTAAAAAGVIVGQVYHNNGALRVRLSLMISPKEKILLGFLGCVFASQIFFLGVGIHHCNKRNDGFRTATVLRLEKEWR